MVVKGYIFPAIKGSSSTGIIHRWQILYAIWWSILGITRCSSGDSYSPLENGGIAVGLLFETLSTDIELLIRLAESLGASSIRAS